MNAPAPKLPDPIEGTPSPPPAAASPPAPASEPAATPPAGDATPPAPGATPPAKGSSIYDAAGVDPPGADGSASWPTNWREQMAEAAGDPKSAKILERFQSPAEVAKALLAAQQKIRSGEYKRAAPATDNPEELKAWREEQGIPETPDGYELPAVEGVDLTTLDDTTKASIDLLRGGLHKAGLNKEQGGVVAQAFLELARHQNEATAQADASNRDAVEDALRAEWGADYRRNLNLNGALLNQHFGENMDAVLNARTPDGRRLADIPEFNKFLNTMARATGGDELFTGDVSGGTSIEARLDQIRQIMSSNIGEYYDKGLDKEYAQLLEKREARKR